MTAIVGIIPARYGSTRFPGKPLVMINGKSMIQRVYEQCLKADLLKDIIVATDDERIAEHVRSFNGHVELTSPDHQSGTDRCAEVINKMNVQADIVINIQGDEPFIDPLQIKLLAGAFEEPATQIATLIKKISSEDDIKNPNVVKVIQNTRQQALYFSRTPIPYRRNPSLAIQYYKHIGIYGYRKDTLLEITRLPHGLLEQAEMLEQLRWVEAGYPIALRETEMETISIDTPSDLALVEKMMKS